MNKILKKEYQVVTKNELNGVYPIGWTFQELRLFAIYLSKINPQRLDTRVVHFSLDDFQSIMELGRIDIANFKKVTTGLLTKVASKPTESGGLIVFQIFKQAALEQDENSQWFIEIDAHDEALTLMFGMRSYFFKYQLWNALNVKSRNQLRMYQVLKQYQNVGYRVLYVKELRRLLGLAENEYKRFSDFKKRVLDSCQEALAKYTDITFTYEPYGKMGQGGKVLQLKFNISKNKNYTDQLRLEEFIELPSDGELRSDGEAIEAHEENSIFELLSEACDDEFTLEQIAVLHALIKKIVPWIPGQKGRTRLDYYDYLNLKYKELNYQASKREIPKRFGYLKTIIKIDYDKSMHM